MVSVPIFVSVSAMSLLAGPPTPPMQEGARQSIERIERIERLEGSRAGTDDLIAFAAPSQRPSIRARALLAIARNAADTDRLGRVLAEGLAAREQEVRQMAAFAIGELRQPRHESLLTALIPIEPERAVVREAWKALGRVGGELTLKRVETALPHYRHWAVEAAGLVARRLKREPWKVATIAKALRDSNPRVLAAALYAISRGVFRDGPTEIYHHVVKALGHSDATVRMQASKALSGRRFKDAKLVDIAAALTGASLSPHQKAWMLRGWAGSGTDAQWDALVAKLAAQAFVDLTGPGFHVLAAALQERGPRKDGTLQYLLEGTATAGQEAAGAVSRRRRHLWCLDRFRPDCLNSPVGVGVAMKAGAVQQVLRLAGDPKASATLRMAALSAMAPVWKKGASKHLASRSKVLTRALQSKDGPLVAVAAGVVRDQRLATLAPLVLSAQRRFQGNVEVAADLTRAAAALGDARTRASIIARAAASKETSMRRLAVTLRSKYHKESGSQEPVFRASPAPPEGRPGRWSATSPVGPMEALLRTDLGVIRLALRSDLAPGTVANFVTLARRGYYDGVKFHRVVPGFVVQAGDPRGDGWGGPGHTILCENNPAPYDTGVVGMALAGKDTGGSQWFITLTPQPHLLGTYTVFGTVLEGMDVVRRLTRDDPILSISVVTPDTPR